MFTVSFAPVKLFSASLIILLLCSTALAGSLKSFKTNVLKEQAYNVKDFGAKGDGKNDDVPAIQKALDYLVDHGGGTLYFPNGHYRLATIQEKYEVKAHLIIKPKVAAGRSHVMIKIVGENAVNTASAYANHTTVDKSEVWVNGTVLFSDILGEKHTDPKKEATFLLAMGSGGGIYKLNHSLMRIQDIAFQVKAQTGKYPNLSGLNMAYAASLYTDNVLIYSSVRSVDLTAPTDDGHYSAGLVAPRLWCNPEQDFRNIYVKTAFRYGMIFSEHANGNNLSVWNCDQAFVFSKMDHSSWFGRIHAQNCKNIINSLEVDFSGHVVGTSFIKIEQVGIEVNSGQIPLSFNYSNFILDPENRLFGKLDYHLVKSNVGADNSYFKKNGGLHIKASPSF
ncbi:glycosyl hydrolase family 28-related protein [Sphingobacterium sp. HJSM2_6]|uniref:glycosyl hydrolase family 28-related protein n=1 Tax=Sphingobacterium sp. HJSM2_6 TaxID=3366264 RepID=UPI003BC65892